MPAVRAFSLPQRCGMLHERHALALDRVSDQRLRTVADVAERGERGPELADVVAVARRNVPAEDAEALVELAQRDDLVRRLVGLQLVAVDDDRELVQRSWAAAWSPS